MDDAWERELAADRQRAAHGGVVENDRAVRQHRGDVDSDLANYYSAAAGGPAPGANVVPPAGAYHQQRTQCQPAGMPPSANPVHNSGPDVYPVSDPAGNGYAGAPPAGYPVNPAMAAVPPTSAYGSAAYPPAGPVDQPPPGTAIVGFPVSSATQHVYNPQAYPTDFDDMDPRFGVKFASMLPEHERKFKSKIGRLLYFTAPVDSYFKGMFGATKYHMVLFVTPRSIWLGEASTGKLVVCKDILDIRTLFRLGDSGIGMRTGSGADLFFKGVPNRDRFVTVIQRLYEQKGEGATFTLVTGDGDREKSYRKEINYLKIEEWDYRLVEDPRTGLPLVPVPERHLQYYAPLAPKNLHWFGGAMHVHLDYAGKHKGTRRGCWVTPTCIFLSVHTGPKPDGSDIVRCIPIESLRFVINGPGFAIGLSIHSKPPQPDCIIDFDDLAAKRAVVFALERCFRCRSDSILVVRDAPHFDVLKLADERGFKPHLHRMATVADLYGLLRSAT